MEPIRVVRGGKYVPDWGNADRADADKITVEYRFLSFAEQQELLDPTEIGKSMAYESRIVERMVTKVHNLSVDLDGDVKPVKDGSDIVNTPGLDGLALELWLHFRKLAAVDKKKSQSASSSGKKESMASGSDQKSETAE